MPQHNQLSKREEKVLELLLQGKSNKQIALALSITESTVEFHLKHVYDKLGVRSRTEAILKQREYIGTPSDGILGGSTADKLVESTVDRADKNADTSGKPISQIGSIVSPIKKGINIKKRWIHYMLAALMLGSLWYYGTTLWIYARECENPEQRNVGQTIQRPHGSGGQVHGQFGTMPVDPWQPKPGFVTYNNIISFSLVTHWYLTLDYSKNSPQSAPILIFIDNEPTQRATLFPIDQGDWDQFAQIKQIDLGNVWIGVHSITFYTDGQQYGVADLDRFVLTTAPPSTRLAPTSITP